ncbi:DcaP family trimeric outer membrane transporter [Edaphobacter bradus]|uniref:DcaP family trimeric outer membrane transporter n=1 Tax=Edaphobacter bradus TaxID=2259016 RepID=UPI0021DF50ED|nr:DcaP family trimeric outer membrane transporter [Edaphobacter bradus]
MKRTHSQTSQRLLIALAMGFILTSLPGVSARAQDQPPQTPDMQQMQKRLSQLENEVQQLKQQMSAAAQVSAQELNAAVSNPTNPNESEQPVKPKTGSSVDVYGFVMLDSGYNFGANDPNWFDVVRPTKLPAFAGQFGPNGSTYWGVRQTRIGIKTLTPTAMGDLKTTFEWELFGTGVDAGQTTFRLRHAWGEMGHFGAGQTWSPFMDIGVFPDSVEYWGPNGMVFFRNVQFRFTPLQKGDSNIQIALERPGASADQGIYAGRVELANVVPHFKWPDLSGHVKYAGDWGYVQVAGIVRKIAWVDTGTGPFHLSGYAVGAGVNVSSNLKFTKRDTGKLAVMYGHGVENYMNDAPVDIGVKNNFSNPIRPIKGVALPVLGVVAFLDHVWSTRYATSVGYSMLNIDNSNASAPSDFHQGHYALGNLLYHPVPRVTMASEFQFGRRVNFSNGYNYNQYRLQFSFRYDWSKGFEF